MKKYLLVGLGASALVVLMSILWIAYLLSDLPDVSSLKHYRPPAAAEVIDRDGNFLATYYDRKFRIWVPLSNLPDSVIHAVVIAEDDTFFGHKGVNYKATWDALVHDVRKRRFARGGSTITQQMIKNVFLSKEKTISRKVREYVLARKTEEILTKRQILEIYVNEVEWGENIYGIEAASRFYLDKHAAELTSAEAALLAGMLPNPRYYDPYKRMEKARQRQERILFNMQQAKVITLEEYSAALSAPLTLRKKGAGKLYFESTTGNGKACYLHALERSLLAVFGEYDLYRSGRTIRTTLDKSLQDELNQDEDPSSSRAADEQGEFLVVKQGDQIKAFICSIDRAREIRELFELGGFLYSHYDVSTVSPESISREQIILPPSDEAK